MANQNIVDVVEQKRLNDAREAGIPWKKWGPYLSERQWGTVREDYSEDGNAWDHFSHDQARSRAYRWGEDGLGGLCDDKQRLCFALAVWNGRDPILKERLYGLTNSEANHGEDVKEYYFYVDSTPTHSYMKYLYKYPLDENEFLGPHGIRSISRYHLNHPFTFSVGHQEYKVQYLPAESNTGMFGGNSNWRGPVWMPVNALIIRGLLNLYAFYGDEFKVQCPTGSGRYLTLFEVAQEISRRLAGSFLRDAQGRRPIYGGIAKFQEDPHWRDLILFHEYFHGDKRLLVAVNFAPNQSQCHVQLPFTHLAGSQWRLQDTMSSGVYDRDGNELQSRGLFLDMLPWQTAVFSWMKIS
jgi:hypothetical protein